MIVATLETRSFTFMTLGRSRRACLAQLRKAWATHCQQTGADPDYWTPSDVAFHEIKVGQVMRDGSLIG